MSQRLRSLHGRWRVILRPRLAALVLLLAAGGAAALDYTPRGLTSTNVDNLTGDVNIGAGHFDGDRRPDMAMCLRREFIHLFSQDAAGEQVLRRTEKLWDDATPPHGGSPYVIFHCRLHVADLDANGVDDLVVTHSLGTVVLKLFADGRVARQEYARKGAGFASGDGFRDSVMVDFDSDGDMDLLGLREDGRALSLLANPGDGQLAAPVDVGARIGPDAWDFQLAAGDLDGNGFPDLAIPVYGSKGAALAMFLNDGQGRLLDWPLPWKELPVRVSASHVAIGDVTDDGRDDLVVVGGALGLEVHEQDRDGSLKAPVGYATYNRPDYVAIHDLDGDGRNDVLVLHPHWLAVSTFLQRSGGTLEYDDLLMNVSNIQLGEDAVAIRDFRGDGCHDLLVATQHYRWLDGTGCLPASNADVSASVLVNSTSASMQVENRDPANPAHAVVATLRLDSTGITTAFPAAPAGCTVSAANVKARVYVCRIGRLEPGEIRTYTLAYTHKRPDRGRYRVAAVARIASHGEDPQRGNNVDRRDFWQVQRTPAAGGVPPVSLPMSLPPQPARRPSPPARARPAPVRPSSGAVR